MSDSTQCAECLTETPDLIPTQAGARVCSSCATSYYVACGGCTGLVPTDEVKTADGCSYCLSCHTTIFGPGEDLSPQDVDTLVAEYARLDAEHKALGKRLEELKERIKSVAATRERVSGTVLLGSGAERVSCTYSVLYRCNSERAATLEPLLGTDRFDAIFERKLSVKRAGLESLLQDSDPKATAARAAVESVVEAVETPRVTVMRPKQSKKAKDVDQ